MEITLIALLLVVLVIIIALIVFFTKKNAKTKQSQPQTGIDKDAKDALSTKFSAASSSKSTAKAPTDTSDPASYLLSLDLGSDLTTKLLKLQEDNKPEDIKTTLTNWYNENATADSESEPQRPEVYIFVGVNGVGKTTTIGKIAHLKAKQGKKVVLAAADTFRAAAADQLEIWEKRANTDTNGNVSLVRGENGADPASVAFQAAKKAVDEDADYLFVDTAGRQQTNQNLMDELGKIKRIIEKHTSVDEIYLVVDGTTGQTVRAQAKKFHEVTEITGVVVTKLDGSTKGGAVFSVVDEIKAPVTFIGTGEGVSDIAEFAIHDYVENL